MHRIRLVPLAGTTLAALALLSGCGGGGNDDSSGISPPAANGTLRLSLTDPLANAVTPSGGVETALTTPSGQQSGLKMTAGAPARLAYAAGTTAFNFGSMAAVAGLYRLEASAPGRTIKAADITLTADVTTSFDFLP